MEHLLQFQEFLEKYINGIHLSKLLFYQAEIGLRFEQGAKLNLEKGRMKQI